MAVGQAVSGERQLQTECTSTQMERREEEGGGGSRWKYTQLFCFLASTSLLCPSALSLTGRNEPRFITN